MVNTPDLLQRMLNVENVCLQDSNAVDTFEEDTADVTLALHDCNSPHYNWNINIYHNFNISNIQYSIP